MIKDLFDEIPDWEQELKPLIVKYKDKAHPLNYKNIYQLLVMVILSAQYSDAKINALSVELFKKFPNMQALSKANIETLTPYIHTVKFYEKKAIKIFQRNYCNYIGIERFCRHIFLIFLVF